MFGDGGSSLSRWYGGRKCVGWPGLSAQTTSLSEPQHLNHMPQVSPTNSNMIVHV